MAMSPPRELTATLLLAVLSASLGTWFILGYNIVALNGPQTVVIRWIRAVECSRYKNDSLLWCSEVLAADEPALLAKNPKLNSLWAITSSITGVGGIIAILTCASLVNRYGPKKSLFIVAGVTAVGAVMSALSPLANSYEVLIVGRTITGLAMGMSCAITPIYTSEIAPVNLRGAMGTFPVIMMVLSMCVGTVLGLPFVLGSGTSWAILIVLQLVPVAIMVIVLFFCPESPSYLYITKKDQTAAERALFWLRGTVNVKAELTCLERELFEAKHRDNISVIGIFRRPSLRLPLLICCVNMAAQHFVGYGCVTTYSTSIFTSIGLSVEDAIYASLGLWLTYLLVALGSMVTIDRLGRRTLLITSHVCIVVSLCMLLTFMALTRQGFTGTKYGSAVSMFCFVSSYAIGLATIPYIVTSELFAQEARAAAMTVACVVNWTAVLVTTFVFSAVVPFGKEYTFIAFIFLTVLTGSFAYWKLPETRGKSIEEIQLMLRNDRIRRASTLRRKSHI